MNARIETFLDELRAHVGNNPDKAQHVDAIEHALATVYRRGSEDDGHAIETWDGICWVIGWDADLPRRTRAVGALLVTFAEQMGWRRPS
jgi:hypothetical protein